MTRILYRHDTINTADAVHQWAVGGHVLHVESNADTVTAIALIGPEDLTGAVDQGACGE